MRWWTLDEVTNSTEMFAPRDLGVRLAALLQDGPPDAPIVLEDQHPDF